jgi:hypothetical protein
LLRKQKRCIRSTISEYRPIRTIQLRHDAPTQRRNGRVDGVVFVGGSMRIPRLQTLVEGLFANAATDYVTVWFRFRFISFVYLCFLLQSFRCSIASRSTSR